MQAMSPLRQSLSQCKASNDLEEEEICTEGHGEQEAASGEQEPAKVEMEDDYESEPVDPRVRAVLEEMTDAMARVNRTENAVIVAQRAFQDAISNGCRALQEILSQPGVRLAVGKAKDFMAALHALHKGQQEAKIVARQYNNAAIALEEACKAEETVEQQMAMELQDVLANGLEDEKAVERLIALSNITQEAVNQATANVHECKQRLERIGQLYEQVAQWVTKSQSRLAAAKEKTLLQPVLAASVKKAQQYYQAKSVVEDGVARQYECLEAVMEQAVQAKKQYADATRNIKRLSQDISSQRSASTLSLTPDLTTTTRPITLLRTSICTLVPPHSPAAVSCSAHEINQMEQASYDQDEKAQSAPELETESPAEDPAANDVVLSNHLPRGISRSRLPRAIRHVYGFGVVPAPGDALAEQCTMPCERA